MKLFDKVIEHDWFLDNEAVARKYLAEHPEGPVRSLAQIVTTMARAQSGHYAEALASFNSLMAGLGGSEQEEFASNFADTLATAAMSAGEHEVARKVYQTLLKKFGGDSPNLKPRRSRTNWPGSTGRQEGAGRRGQRPERGDSGSTTSGASTCWSTSGRPGAPLAWSRSLGSRPLTPRYHAKGLEIVAVSLDEAKGAVVDFAKARKLPWKQVHNATAGGDLVEAFGVRAIPATFLISPEGTIIRLELRGQSLDKALEALIK